MKPWWLLRFPMNVLHVAISVCQGPRLVLADQLVSLSVKALRRTLAHLPDAYSPQSCPRSPFGGPEREKGRPQTPRDAEVHSGLDVDSLQVWRQLQSPMPLAPMPGEASLTFFSDAKAEETQAWIGGYLYIVEE